VLRALQQIYTEDRVRDLNIKIDMDMSKKSVKTEEFFPFTKKPDNPNTPYDDSDIVPSVTRSTSETTYEYQGTGFNPEGPAGAEGQTAPAYKDLQNMVARPPRPRPSATRRSTSGTSTRSVLPASTA
jgi:flagellar M-ring protein FliF